MTYADELKERLFMGTDLLLVSDLIDVTERHDSLTGTQLLQQFTLMVERGGVVPRGLFHRVPVEFPRQFGEKSTAVTWNDAVAFAKYLGHSLPSMPTPVVRVRLSAL